MVQSARAAVPAEVAPKSSRARWACICQGATRIRVTLKPLLSAAALLKSAVSRLMLGLEESDRLWQQRDLAEEKILYLYWMRS